VIGKFFGTRCSTIWFLRCWYAMNDVANWRPRLAILNTRCNNSQYADMQWKVDPIILWWKFDNISDPRHRPFKSYAFTIIAIEWTRYFLNLICISYRVWNYVVVAISVKSFIGDQRFMTMEVYFTCKPPIWKMRYGIWVR